MKSLAAVLSILLLGTSLSFADPSCSHLGRLPWPKASFTKKGDKVQLTSPYGVFEYPGSSRRWDFVGSTRPYNTEGFVGLNFGADEPVFDVWLDIPLRDGRKLRAKRSAVKDNPATVKLTLALGGKERTTEVSPWVGWTGFYQHPSKDDIAYITTGFCTIGECPCGFNGGAGVFELNLATFEMKPAFGRWNGLASNDVVSMFIDDKANWFATAVGICRLGNSAVDGNCWTIKNIEVDAPDKLVIYGGNLHSSGTPLAGVKTDNFLRVTGIRGGSLEMNWFQLAVGLNAKMDGQPMIINGFIHLGEGVRPVMDEVSRF